MKSQGNRKNGNLKKQLLLAVLFILIFILPVTIPSFIEHKSPRITGHKNGTNSRSAEQTATTDRTVKKDQTASESSDQPASESSSDAEIDDSEGESENDPVRRVWTGMINSSWADANNWSPSGAPDRDDTAIIPDDIRDIPFPVVRRKNARVKKLVVDRWASLELAKNSRLRVYGKLNIKGTLKGETATLVIRGSADRTIPGATYGTLVLRTSGIVTFDDGVNIMEKLVKYRLTRVRVRKGSVTLHGDLIQKDLSGKTIKTDPIDHIHYAGNRYGDPSGKPDQSESTK